MMRVKQNDTVLILTGKNKNKRSRVIDILPKKDKVLVEGSALVMRHAKARRQGETSGIKSKESYIQLSNVMPVCVSCNKPARPRSGISHDNIHHVRICNHCNQIM